MRGEPERQMAMLTTISTEYLTPADHPIRRIRNILRTAELRPAVQVVPGPADQCGRLRPHHVHQEPGAPARGRDRRPVLRRSPSPAKLRRYVSSEHFSVDGTLLEAWASHKSFKPKQGPPPPAISGGRNSEVDFRGLPRSNRTHRSTTDPEALLASPTPHRPSCPTPATCSWRTDRRWTPDRHEPGPLRLRASFFPQPDKKASGG
jgi:hypothetical protein